MSRGYSDVEIDAIAGWLREGLTASQITASFGRSFRPVTRNAIIGVVHRNKRLAAIGFAAQGRVGRAAGAAAKPKATPRRRLAAPSPGAPAARIRLPDAPTSPARGEAGAAPATPSAAKLLADLAWHECRWPVNNAAPGEQHLFCAARRGNGPYCHAHALRAGAGYSAGEALGRRAA